MSTTTTSWILELLDRASAPLKVVRQAGAGAREMIGQVNENLKKTQAIDLYAIADSARQLNQEFQEAIRPGIAYESTLADVSAITGVTGDKLDKLGSLARQSAKDFGTSASQPLENYKTLLSKLGPEIGQNEAALESMNRTNLTLSKTMDNDVRGAVEASTTAVLQYGVDLTNATQAAKTMDEMVNVMAAGAKEGAAEVVNVAQSIKVAGVEASKSNVSFAATNAAIQELAKGGKIGSEAGTALRNVLGKMAGADIIPKEALEKLQRYGVDMNIVSDTTLPFTDRLRELGKAQGDATAFAQVFGVENAAAANILVRSADAQDSLAAKITGTNVAYEQAATKMDTYEEQQKRLTAIMEDWGITLFNATKPFIPFIIAGLGAVQMLAHLANAKKGVALIANTTFITSIRKSGLAALIAARRYAVAAVQGLVPLITSLFGATAAQWALNVAMTANPIGLIIVAVAAVIAIIVVMIKYWDNIKLAISKFAAWIAKNNPFEWMVTLIDKVFPGFREKIEALKTWVKNLLLGVWESIKKVWQGIKEFFGFGDEETDVEIKVKTTPDGDGFDLPTPSPTGDLKKLGGGAAPEKEIVSGNGKGAKILTMNLDIINNFNLSPGNWKGKVDELADAVVGKINDRLRDGAIALE